MTDQNKAAPQPRPSSEPGAVQVNEAFFSSVNEFVQLANRLAREQSLEHASAAALFAAARFNTHVFLATMPAASVAAERGTFLDHMNALYRRMLNQHLDGQGRERGIDVGASELAQDQGAKTDA